MKKAFNSPVLRRALCLLGVGLLLAGCTFHYDVTLQNGDVIEARRKPKRDERGNYVFQDLSGKEVVLSPLRVKEIQPATRKLSSSSKRF